MRSCGAVRVCDYSAAASPWIVVSVNISSSRLPLGVTTTAVSPTFLFSSERPIGEVVEILPAATSDSSLVTRLYSTSSFFVLSNTFTVEPSPILSLGMLFMFTMESSARRFPSWRTRAFTYSWRCLAMWYSAFSLRSPSAAAFLISFGSSWASSCSRALISSSNFFFTCSGMDLAVPSAPERHGGDQELGRSERQFTLRTGRGVRSIDRFPSDYTPRDSANKQSDAPTFTHPKGLN